MTYLYLLGSAVFLIYGLSIGGARIFALFAVMFFPALVLISSTLSGWVATVAAAAALAVVILVLRGPMRRRTRAKAAENKPNRHSEGSWD
jgi:membrane protein implicated in regulation of membrane protease activity